MDQMSDSRQQMVAVREFENDKAAGAEHPRDFGQHWPGIAKVHHQAHSDDHIDGSVTDGDGRGRGLDDREPGITTNRLAGRCNHLGRCINECHALECRVFIAEPPEAGSQIQEVRSASGQQGPERDPVAAVLVRTRRPELVAIREVIPGRPISHDRSDIRDGDWLVATWLSGKTPVDIGHRRIMGIDYEGKMKA